MAITEWTQRIPVAFAKKQSSWFWIGKEPSASMTQAWSRPKLCVEWSWSTQKITLRHWSYETCIAVADLDTGGGSFSCTDVENCINTSTIVQEAIVDTVLPLIVHGNHIGLTATYNAGTNEIILEVTWWWGGWFTCSDVAACITSNVSTQTALLSWLQWLTSVTFNGTRNRWATSVQNYTAWSTVSGDVSYVDFDQTLDSNSSITYNWTTVTGTVNQTNLVVNNTNVDTTNDAGSSITNNWNTITNTNVTQNSTWGSINNTNVTQTNTWGSITNTNTSITNTGTTTITWWTYNSTTINNATFTGTITWAAALWSDEKIQATWTTSSQVIPLTTVPRSWIKSLQITVVGGIIQISPSDYTYNAGTNEITMVTVPPVNPTTIEIQYPIKDALVALPADTLQVTQTAHGFVALDWIRFDETTSTWVKAQANTVWGLWSWHVVSVVDANTFLVSKDGTHTIPNALAQGEYVLSDATAGWYTQTLPTNNSSYILYGMEVIDANTVNFYTVVWVSVASISGWSSWSIYVSPAQTFTASTNYTITHNLWITQSDVEQWRYALWTSWTNGGQWMNISPYDRNWSTTNLSQHNWSASPASGGSNVNRQANTVNINFPSIPWTFTNWRIIIYKMR